MAPNYIALAIPFFFLLMGLEWWVARRRKRDVYRLNDSVNDLSCGIMQQVVDVFLKTLLLGVYTWVYLHGHLFEIRLDSVWMWVLCFLGVDFAYYWFHRSSHEVNAIWATHVVHHQSEEYNLSVALRQSSLQPIFVMLFYLPLALIGFPPLMFLAAASFNTLYQFWIHTRLIGRLGPYEWVFNTPSHHRVHHGRDPKYIDKNHGGTLIIWDRLFGTFQAEEEEPTYGITKPLESWNPFWANSHYWIELVDSARRTRAPLDKLRVFSKQPGWFPDDLGGPQAPPPVPADPPKYDPALPAGLTRYAACQFLVLLPPVTLLLFLQASLSTDLKVAAALFVIWSLIAVGLLFERNRTAFRLEWLRLGLAVPLVVWALPVGYRAVGLAVILVAVALMLVPWFGLRRSFAA
ncbi:sterol desaturase family protein [Acanthopleuribacter pedis]|uniref:Sterol desaturase family protein n=1 Tax=Acanthopleuribacter pedis TaxID=442870 RepID=A0A8J7Q4A9_9BACT|nr:sterol desaturase family protein [Acanthopleuribacter pedis]MBO1317802.1 sterol desaturase family protein [Acanthopleuribacter pedis]